MEVGNQRWGTALRNWNGLGGGRFGYTQPCYWFLRSGWYGLTTASGFNVPDRQLMACGWALSRSLPTLQP